MQSWMLSDGCQDVRGHIIKERGEINVKKSVKVLRVLSPLMLTCKFIVNYYC